MTDDRNLTTKDTGTECTEVYENGYLVARIVPHDSGFGWKVVGPQGKGLSTRAFETRELTLQYLPRGLR